MFMDEVNCKVVAAEQSEVSETNDSGEAAFKIKSADTIFIYHPIFSDRASAFIPKNKTANYFEFKIEPSIMEIFCDSLVLEMKDGKLVGNHPLLDAGKEYEYVKGNWIELFRENTYFKIGLLQGF